MAKLYRNRWQIETFFKWIKQNLTIKNMGTFRKRGQHLHLDCHMHLPHCSKCQA
ncbi:transposase [Zunongwangia sp. F260]|uniref:Transposase n=1 Tax=Autumnicola lenta TaxID=3075593 RepID=A0ABU3CJ10_9FLAO|nr:transposase [Zunongwangia sp. F260]MDT0646301.1 transposase [Zunongwangia sp. F260]